MKITKISKKKNNLYEITTSNNDKISLYDDVILKYNLLITKEIKDDELKDILKDNSYLESYNIALKYIISKLRTEKEIRKKLINFNKDAVNYTLDRLKKEGYLNDNIYIKAYINDEVNLKMTGPNKIMQNLKKLGFKENDINNYLMTFNNDIWQDKIRKYISKKISSNHNLSSQMLKQKIIQDLIVKGFYKEDILFILNEFELEDDKAIYDKEYLKLKNKLSRKYSGEELEYQIKNHLYKKGFKL